MTILRGAVMIALVVSAIAPTAHAQTRDLPIVDVHFHAFSNLNPVVALRAMDRAGVTRAGNGARGPDELWRPLLDAAPDRFLPHAAQGQLNILIRRGGERALTLQDAETNRYLEGLESRLKSGQFRGIGELFPNNIGAGAFDNRDNKFAADSPLMRRLLKLGAAYNAPPEHPYERRC